jgi:hypothetical protein
MRRVAQVDALMMMADGGKEFSYFCEAKKPIANVCAAPTCA